MPLSSASLVRGPPHSPVTKSWNEHFQRGKLAAILNCLARVRALHVPQCLAAATSLEKSSLCRIVLFLSPPLICQARFQGFHFIGCSAAAALPFPFELEPTFRLFERRQGTNSLSLSCPRVSERERCQLSSCSPNRKGKTTYCTFDERTVPSDACIRVQLARTIQHASNVASRVPTFNPFWALQ